MGTKPTKGRVGRPAKPARERRRNRVVVLITDSERAQLSRVADKAQVTPGAMAYRLLADALRQEGK